MKKLSTCILWILCLPICSQAESLNIDYETIINEIMDKQANSDEDNVYEDLYEYLTTLIDSPINLNTVNRQELEKFPLLNQYQIENLLEYRFDYGELLSIHELRLIEGFDDETVRYCSAFFTTEQVNVKNKVSIKDIFKHGKHQLQGNASTTVQEKRGYTENKYNGNPYGGLFKYKFTHKNLNFSLTCESDAGESFSKNGGFDFYSANITLKDIGHCKTLAIGDYKVNFGQGLVMKSNYYYGLSSDPGAIIQRQDAISPYTSATEYGYLRGVANTWKIKNVETSFFYSHTNYKDYQNYHRTDTELASKNSNPKNTVGANINYYHNKFKIGGSYVHDITNNKINAGIDYRTKIHKFELAGEFALNEKLKPAVIQSVAFWPDENISFSALYRYYHPEYESYYGNAYNQSSLNNEAGLLMGIGLKPFEKWKFSANADMFCFFKPKSTIFKPSDGFKIKIDATYLNNDNFSLYGRYYITVKESNLSSSDYDSPEQQSSKYNKHQFKLSYYVKLMEIMELKGGINGSCYTTRYNSETDIGWVLNNELKIKLFKSKLSLAAGLSFFDIEEYSNRIYLYESGLPYTYSSTMYYGQGCRTYFVLSYKAGKVLSLNFKASHVVYSDERTEVGSSYETIQGNKKTDLKLLAIIKL